MFPWSLKGICIFPHQPSRFFLPRYLPFQLLRFVYEVSSAWCICRNQLSLVCAQTIICVIFLLIIEFRFGQVFCYVHELLTSNRFATVYCSCDEQALQNRVYVQFLIFLPWLFHRMLIHTSMLEKMLICKVSKFLRYMRQICYLFLHNFWFNLDNQILNGSSPFVPKGIRQTCDPINGPCCVLCSSSFNVYVLIFIIYAPGKG